MFIPETLVPTTTALLTSMPLATTTTVLPSKNGHFCRRVIVSVYGIYSADIGTQHLIKLKFRNG